MRNELKVNSTCGASNISFGLPQREGISGAFLTMAIASGLTSAITNPLHAEILKAIMGADVMMGHDPDCARWIRKYREAAGRRRHTEGAGRGRREGGHRRRVYDALVVFTPSGKRGRFAIGTPLLQAARELGVDIDSVCGGRALCGRCQVLVMEGDFAKHSVKSTAQNLSPYREAEVDYAARRPLPAGHRLSCSARILGDLVVDVPLVEPGAPAGGAKSGEARDIVLDPVLRLHEVEVEQPDMHNPSGDLRRLMTALKREWQLDGLTCDVEVLPGCRARCATASGR